ncbi:copper oxidase [Cryobacterium sp. MDB1-18-2]|uniref:multicopper oxidase domain-containing protein n=1 Tax=unclassified Cryobacterium TaxID=2649013 RepID=UPI00106C147E|nr:MULTISPECIES: multicopper oxidase domain-containing protein [unclassified Cryobacterium]MEB0003430.1 multicopper oxidase domain-containing protein [Cryobacterium sp. RTC2.1]MEB0287538.1 multicopper oxidase domain-containing protein [Cryobacterium sp. 10S3]MEB0305107.1 multicopper oxidase domain-containing protein [Cryobacterium sp. 10I1]TFC24838.1 copper oxidase [Cryobacterium sp. MDB1-18-2]TFC39493.1 copper oxidase [Cryobacterium sp. MDB1-18-1]
MMKGNAVLPAKIRARGVRRAALLLALTLVGATMATFTQPAIAVTPPRVGIACTTGVGGGATTPIFNLTTRTGYISLPDGNTAFMWGYSSGFGAFQHPGPVLCVNAGDTVTVILRNTLPEAASIAFPGQTNVLANGTPAQPESTGSSAITSLTTTAAAGGGTVTYSFVAANPGTFVYESGTNPEKQVRMGLFGALIVRPSAVPSGGAAGSVASEYANNRADSRFNPAEEFMVLLSEIDPYQHQAVENGKSFNMNNYHPRYWLINGRGYPDSIADNGASWLPAQPYGALAQVGEFDRTAVPVDQPGMARYLNVGTEDYPFHPHGNNGLVVARDGRPLEGPTGEDLAFEKFAINIGPGQTWDVIFKWYDAENYSPSNPVPVTVPSLADQSIGVFYSGSPYLGTKEALPPGIQSVNQCGEYYIISHNHALFQITSWGTNMTGPITYMRIDPPTPNSCG